MHWAVSLPHMSSFTLYLYSSPLYNYPQHYVLMLSSPPHNYPQHYVSMLLVLSSVGCPLSSFSKLYQTSNHRASNLACQVMLYELLQHYLSASCPAMAWLSHTTFSDFQWTFKPPSIYVALSVLSHHQYSISLSHEHSKDTYQIQHGRSNINSLHKHQKPKSNPIT